MSFTRREVIKGTSALAVASLGMWPKRKARAAEELRVMTWAGYSSDEIVQDFITDTGVNVARTFVSNNDEYMAKLAAGGADYDVCVVVTALAQHCIKAKFIEPLDLDKIPNFKDLYPAFQTLKYYQSDGKTYGVPTYWGLIPLTFNSDVIPDRNDFEVLFDPQFKGRIGIWDDISSMALVAQWMGIKNIWDMSDSELEAVKAKMIEQRPLVRKYWTQSGEAIELFASGEIVASISFDSVTQALNKAGHHARQPSFGIANAYCDAHTIITGTSKRDLAHEFINYMISPKTQAKIATIPSYRVTNPLTKQLVDPVQWQFLDMDRAAEELPTTEFWGEVPRRAKYLEVWNEIKAAPVE